MWPMALLASAALLAQAGAPVPPAIEDNSFLIEEAYNQEPGVIQHISTFLHVHGSGRRTDYSFTQEWPVASQRHQLSYTLPYAWLGEQGHGVGDLYLNYRYQLTGHDAWATLSPRLSVAVPTRGDTRGGLQVNLPISKRVARRLVVHANAGATYLRGVRVDHGRRDLRAINAGGSAIALVSPSFNVMLEVVAGFEEDARPDGRTRWDRELIVSPGLRKAIDVGSLQIVPGVAVPITMTADRTRAGAFLYLSLEHPLR